MRDIETWLEALDLANYRDAFARNEIAFGDLPELTEADLKEMGLPIGPRRRALKAIAALDDTDAAPAETALSPVAGRAAERRQLTVMFCDLVGSTAMSQQLDPEELRDVMRRYQDAVAGAVTRYQGHVAQFLGDGVLAYFGWPMAYEDQAERAIRASLDAIEAVQAVRLDGKTLRARIGIASGVVVVGDLVGATVTDVQAVTGETPNLAARLQGVAEPGQVVISGATRLLVGATFDLIELGRHDLKGFSDAVLAWRVAGEAAVESRFEASHAGALTRLVGREHELGLLLVRWEMAKNGEGQVMLLSGEAGIGKSRMMRALRETIDDEPYFHLRYQCSPHYANSAFYPIIQRLERAANFTPEDSGDTKLDKLEELLTPTADDLPSIAPLFAALLALPGEARYGALALTPQQLRTRTVAALIEQVIALSRIRPVLFAVEDAHWIDPSTESLIEGIMSRAADAAVFVLITHRPDYDSPWTGHPHLNAMTLSRLSRNQGSEIVREICGLQLSRAMVGRIIARADGVPLYVEELAKSVVESAASAADRNLEDHIPETLQASLMARLDRLGDAKNIAQIGAVIGRDFPHGLIETMTGTAEGALDDALERIVASGLIVCRGTPPNTHYIFKHALIQDAAYQSLLNAERHRLHLKAGEALENHHADANGVPPEVIAHHFSLGGDTIKAARYWLNAGRLAAQSSANMEAISHYTAAHAGLADAAESEARTGLELAAWVGLGPLLMATRGVGSPAVVEAYENALTLAEQARDNDQLFRSKFNIWHVHNVKGDCRIARENAQDLLAYCTGDHSEDHDDGKLLQAHHATWSTAFMRADFALCQDHLERGAAIYDADEFTDHKFIYAGHDPGVCCHMFSSWLFMSIGDIDQSLRRIDDSFALSATLDHPYSTTVAYLGAALSTRFLGLRDAQNQHTIAGIELCESHGLMAWLPILNLSRASLATRQKDRETVEAGITDIIESYEIWTGAGAGAFAPWFHYEIATAKLALGDLAAAEEYLGRSKQACNDSDERWLESDIYRLEAALKEKSGLDPALVSHAYAEAELSARRFGAKLAGLKASTSHARFLGKIGDNQKALEVLRDADSVIDSAQCLSIHDEKITLLKTLS